MAGGIVNGFNYSNITGGAKTGVGSTKYLTQILKKLDKDKNGEVSEAELKESGVYITNVTGN